MPVESTVNGYISFEYEETERVLAIHVTNK